jgi:hypothetical protein
MEPNWVHCYLSCEHVITVQQQDLKESSPHPLIECWACEAEAKNGFAVKVARNRKVLRCLLCCENALTA